MVEAGDVSSSDSSLPPSPDLSRCSPSLTPTVLSSNVPFLGFPYQALRHSLASIISVLRQERRSVMRSLALLNSRSQSLDIGGTVRASRANCARSGWL